MPPPTDFESGVPDPGRPIVIFHNTIQAINEEIEALLEAEDEGINFIIKKGVAIPIELVVESLVELARGLKKAPAFKIGEEIISNTAGAGEEEAIAAQEAQAAAVRAEIEAIRLGELLARGGGVAMRLILRDP